jgi:hypothetical protein
VNLQVGGGRVEVLRAISSMTAYCSSARVAIRCFELPLAPYPGVLAYNVRPRHSSILFKEKSVKAEISIESDKSDRDLASLYQWLTRDPELKQKVKMSTEDAKSKPGEMGLDVDSINAVVANLLAMGSLVVSIAAWRGTQTKPSAVRIKHQGLTAVVNSDSPEAIQSVIDALGDTLPEATDADNERKG